MPSTDTFKLGRCYSRKEIASKLGGGTRSYLPHKNQHVVCGCFRKDLNPDAPQEVLPANTDDKKRWAEQFASQVEAVPIFLKKRSNEWGISRVVAMRFDSEGCCDPRPKTSALGSLVDLHGA
jgi:hypothetical protein